LGQITRAEKITLEKALRKKIDKKKQYVRKWANEEREG